MTKTHSVDKRIKIESSSKLSIHFLDQHTLKMNTAMANVICMECIQTF